MGCVLKMLTPVRILILSLVLKLFVKIPFHSKNVITDWNIFVFSIVAFAPDQSLLHAVRVDTKHIFFVACTFLNNIIE